MLLQDGTIKVTDFGIARFAKNETRTMTDKAIGSVHYIAPEQARGFDRRQGGYLLCGRHALRDAYRPASL